MLLIKQFYDFMFEREMIRLRRLSGLPREEWTSDPIFKAYSFTNVKRDNDRTTMLLKREFYDRAAEQLQGSDQVFDGYCDGDKQSFLLNAAIYRYFGTIDTARVIGWTPHWDDEHKSRILGHGAMGRLGFTSAYIVPAAGLSAPKYMVVCEIVEGIWKRSLEIVQQTRWEDAIGILKDCFGVGSFMAKEVYLDYVLATGFVPEDWQTWTPVGPGGKRGASCIQYGDTYRVSEKDALEIIRAAYERRHDLWSPDLVKLDLTDIQFQCCEFDKYNRVVRGDGKPKRRFSPTTDDVTTRFASDNPEASPVPPQPED